MPFRVSGKNIDVGEALRTKINTRIAEVTAKYFDGGYSGHVTVGKDGFGFRTECVVHLDSGIVFEAEAMAADAYASAEQAALRMEKQLRRYKRRLKDHQAVRPEERRGDQPPGRHQEEQGQAARQPQREVGQHRDGHRPARVRSGRRTRGRTASADPLHLNVTPTPCLVTRGPGRRRSAT